MDRDLLRQCLTYHGESFFNKLKCEQTENPDFQAVVSDLCKVSCESLCDWVASSGIPGIYSAQSEELPSIYVHLVKYYVYHRVASMISQFTEGLNSCGGLWETVQSNWEEIVPVMTSAQQRPLTLEEFKLLFTICYSRPDSQLRNTKKYKIQKKNTKNK